MLPASAAAALHRTLQSWIGCDGQISIELQASDCQLKLHPRPRHGYRGSRGLRSIVEIQMQAPARCSAQNVLSLDGCRPAMVPLSKEWQRFILQRRFRK